jgi:membrane-associated phospholipid phosphatase
VYLAAFHVGFLERADRQVFDSFYNLTYPSYRHRVHDTASFLVLLCDPSHFAFLALLPVVVALARRRFCDAGAVLVLLVGAGGTALMLKHVLPQERVLSLDGMTFAIPFARLPSGHSTAAMGLVLALTFVVPTRFRAVTAGLGAVFAAAVGYSLLTIGSHFPSDVFAGFLVAAIWSLLVAGGLFEVEHRLGTSPDQSRPISIREMLTPPVAALLAILALTVIGVLTNPQSIVSYIREHNAFTAGIVAIAALSTAISTGVVVSARRDAMP